jgi:uncharacterized membrane protein
VRDESEKEVIHRLEAFSDIVIGFSLAQLGLSLTIPPHARDLFTHVRGASGLIALFITFTLVCAVWWMHHRLFRHLFVPVRINIVANFAALCGVILLAYSMQVLLHNGMTDPVAFPMYTGSYAWIMVLFSLIAWNGMRLRGSQMNPQLRLDSMHYAVRLSIIASWLVVMTLTTSVFGVRPEVAQWLFFVLVIPLAINRFIARSRSRRISSPSA